MSFRRGRASATRSTSNTLARTVWTKTENGRTVAYPDTLVGTDSHTTMVNGLGVLGWGVGGIEAEAAMLGQPISMLIPEVVGFELTGALNDGITATDLVLRVVEMLRAHGVVGKFVEFHGDGLDHLPLADRATIANMAPEYGATCGFFPVDAETVRYLALSGRPAETVALVEAYAKAQGLWRDPEVRAVYASELSLDLASIRPSLAGPKRPQDRVDIADLGRAFDDTLELAGHRGDETRVPVAGTDHDLGHGDVVIAAITSCTNTSNPAVMLGAGLVAKKAVERGLKVKPWVKTSLAPGSKVVTEYLAATRLQEYLDRIGFNLVGYGCTTCIGNSGPLPEAVSEAIREGDLVVSSVLSGKPQLRGPRAPGSAYELACVAAARGRLCLGRYDPDQPGGRPSWPGRRRQRRLPSGHLAQHGRGRGRREPSFGPRCSTGNTATF